MRTDYVLFGYEPGKLKFTGPTITLELATPVLMEFSLLNAYLTLHKKLVKSFIRKAF